MKKLRKTIFIVSVLGMILLFGACDNARKNSSDKSLYKHGLELISLLEEMAESEAYLEMYINTSSDVYEIISTAAKGDFTEPKAVYQIAISDDMLLKLLGYAVTDMDGLSDTLKEYVKSRVHNSIVSIINSTGGTDMVAASSICTAGKTFVSDEQVGNVIYLYTYEDAVPVIITFKEGENGAVSASGNFIFCEDFMTDTKQKIEQFFAELEIDVKEIEK